MRIVTGDEMRHIDEIATVEFGIPSLLLMENAGRGVCDVIEDRVAKGQNLVTAAGRPKPT